MSIGSEMGIAESGREQSVTYYQYYCCNSHMSSSADSLHRSMVSHCDALDIILKCRGGSHKATLGSALASRGSVPV